MSSSEPYTSEQIAESDDAVTGDTLGESDKIDAKVMDSRATRSIVREGKLKKKSPKGLIKMWQERYFKLYNDGLLYFKTAKDATPCGFIPIVDIMEVSLDAAKDAKGLRFKVEMRPAYLGGTGKLSSRRFDLIASAREDAQLWVNAMNGVVRGNEIRSPTAVRAAAAAAGHSHSPSLSGAAGRTFATALANPTTAAHKRADSKQTDSDSPAPSPHLRPSSLSIAGSNASTNSSSADQRRGSSIGTSEAATKSSSVDHDSTSSTTMSTINITNNHHHGDPSSTNRQPGSRPPTPPPDDAADEVIVTDPAVLEAKRIAEEKHADEVARQRDADDKVGIERERVHADVRRQIAIERDALTSTWAARDTTAKQLDLERTSLLNQLAELQRQQIASDKAMLLDIREQVIRARTELAAETASLRDITIKRDLARIEWADMQQRMAAWDKTKLAVEREWVERETKRRDNESTRRQAETKTKAQRSDNLAEEIKLIEDRARAAEEQSNIELKDLEGEEAELRAQERILIQVQAANRAKIAAAEAKAKADEARANVERLTVERKAAAAAASREADDAD